MIELVAITDLYSACYLHSVSQRDHFLVKRSPKIIDPTTADCAITLSLIRYLEVLMGPRNLYA